jgi:hypothetical protein
MKVMRSDWTAIQRRAASGASQARSDSRQASVAATAHTTSRAWTASVSSSDAYWYTLSQRQKTTPAATPAARRSVSRAVVHAIATAAAAARSGASQSAKLGSPLSATAAASSIG